MPEEITVADRPEAGRYEITVDGERVGCVTYRLAPGVITFVHTEVEPVREGHGLGSRLVGAALQDARARGLAVRPRCSFVADFIDQHPEYADLVVSDGR